ncbi:MAG: Gfo/Idh/MocA family protein [Gemmatimonadaceae bacterium]
MTQRLRLGIVGGGRVVERLHLPALATSDAWSLVGVADSAPDRRERLRHLVPGAAVTSSQEELLDEQAPDAVLVATPPASHCELAVDALSRGHAVLVEKPMALTPADARAMREARERAGRPLWVGFNRRFYSSYRALKGVLRERSAGQPVSMFFELSAGVSTWRAVGDFQGVDEQGGGVLDDLVSHQLDLLSWLLDEPVLKVSARSTGPRRSAQRVELSVVLGGGAKGGCIAEQGGSYRELVYVVLSNRRLLATPARLWDVTGIPASIAGWLGARHATATGGWRKVRARPSSSVDSMTRQWRSFASVVRGDASAGADEPEGAGADAGVRCVEAVAACRRSLSSGTPSVVRVTHAGTAS